MRTALRTNVADMPVHNADIAAIFAEIADLLEIRGENPFRVRAYRNAARSVGELGRDLKSLIDAGKELPKLPGIGADLAAKIDEICKTGTCKLLQQLHKAMPPAISELLRLPGLGARCARFQAGFRHPAAARSRLPVRSGSSRWIG